MKNAERHSSPSHQGRRRPPSPPTRPTRALALVAAAGLAIALLPCSCDAATGPAVMRERRLALVRSIERQGIRDSSTLAAMRSVPRHEFVPAAHRALAYLDEPLPIGRGQTISQPFIVAFMTEAIRPRPGLRVLEVGTGSGYQAAVLAQIGCRVHTIEIIRSLADSARARLERLGYGAVQVRHGDGYLGWPEAAPFDAILVTAAPERMPQALVDQLAPGGRLVAPVGGEKEVQTLVLLEKDARGQVKRTELLPVRFVPMRKGVRR
jgi:protein-L-isoaspartate(D-aspartate) O-methyltransferase